MDSALPIATVLHTMPGRTRLRIGGRRGDDVFFASVATGLSTIAGVSYVDVRPLTGSVLMQHTAPLVRIAAAAEKSRLFALASADPPPVAPAIAIDPKMVVALGLGALALAQFAQGRILPPAITLGWYAAGLAGWLVLGNAAKAGE